MGQPVVVRGMLRSVFKFSLHCACNVASVYVFFKTYAIPGQIFEAEALIQFIYYSFAMRFTDECVRKVLACQQTLVDWVRIPRNYPVQRRQENGIRIAPLPGAQNFFRGRICQLFPFQVNLKWFIQAYRRPGSV